MAYADISEFAVLLGRAAGDLSEVETARATLVLDMATAVINAELGQSLALEETTAVLDGTGTDVVVLPRWPVTAVASVTVVDDLDRPAKVLAEDNDYRWSADGRLRRLCRCWPRLERAVTVMFTAGYDPIPADVKAMCLRLARAGWDNPAGLQSERIGDWSAQWAVPGMHLTTADRVMLGLYRART